MFSYAHLHNSQLIALCFGVNAHKNLRALAGLTSALSRPGVVHTISHPVTNLLSISLRCAFEVGQANPQPASTEISTRAFTRPCGRIAYPPALVVLQVGHAGPMEEFIVVVNHNGDGGSICRRLLRAASCRLQPSAITGSFKFFRSRSSSRPLQATTASLS